MPSDIVKLVVKGPPGTEISVQTRNRGESEPPVLQAALTKAGAASVVLPRGYYVVLGGGTTEPADFTARQERELTVTLNK